MGFNFGRGFIKFAQKIDGTDQILDAIGLPTLTGKKHGMLTQQHRDEDEAKKQEALAAAQSALQHKQQIASSRAASGDYGNYDVTDVYEGAEAKEYVRRKKNTTGTSISRSLGL